MKTKIGTPYYMAPEILKTPQSGYTSQCDSWSIGVCLYILLSSYPPFYGEDDQAIFASIRRAYYDFKSPCFNYVSREAKDLIRGLLKTDHRQRLRPEEALRHQWLKA